MEVFDLGLLNRTNNLKYYCDHFQIPVSLCRLLYLDKFISEDALRIPPIQKSNIEVIHIVNENHSGKNKLPQFLIIGAQKSGTTWLVDMLRDHRDVFIPRNEVHFFNTHYDRGYDWYASHFSEAKKSQRIGEKTPDYLGGDLAGLQEGTIAQRIKNDLPGVKLIVVLRDPVNRAVSAYNHYVRTRIISPLQSINSYFLKRKFEKDNLGILDYGNYEKHLALFEERFPAEQILILYYEDMMKEKQATMDRVCKFIGVPAFQFPNLELRSNAFKKSRPGLIIHYYVPVLKRLGWQLDKILPTNKQQVNSEVQEYLEDYYSETVLTMKEKLGHVPQKWMY